jgi:lipopolysaccharide export system protein LptA
MKKLLFFLAAFAAGDGLTGAPHAAPAPNTASPLGGKHDNNAPINVSSDSVQADLNAKSVLYIGNVIIVQGDMRLRSNKVLVLTVNGKADKIHASGNVVVDAPSGTATGDDGVYSVEPRTVVMTGNVVLKKGKNVLQGTHGTFNMATGEMALTSTKSAQNPGGRVKAVIMPNSQTQ